MIFECLIHNFPKLTTLPIVQGSTSKGASSSNRARISKSPPVAAPAAKGGKAPATTPAVPASAAKGRKAPPATTQTVPTPDPTPAAKGGKATITMYHVVS